MRRRCNIALSRQAQAVKKGVDAAEATPREFTTITVTDGIAMGHEGMRPSPSLVSDRGFGRVNHARSLL